ncbi:MAG: efflux transporter outer membrane subunit [Zoogloea sp.]|nr:efflux transporter outer membrane subunit [Zoogloea sp.]
MMIPDSRFLVLAAVCMWLGGCAVTSEPARMQMELPAAWNEPETPGHLPTRAWWRGFDSAELERLVQASLAGSPDLAIAVERVTQAEATVRSAGASLFPSLNLGASASTRRSDPGGGGAVSVSDSTGLSLGVSYEVDLWGRIDAGVRSARASLEGSRHDVETARLTLTSGVANAYFQVLAVRARLAIARDNLAIAERVLRIVETRYRAGAGSALDVSSQRTTVLTQRAALLPLQVQERQTVSALAVLVGRIPEGFGVAGEDLQRLAIPQIAPVLPGELLTQRPDLAKAETQLVAADANLDAARAALLPSLQLSASGGLASSALMALADPSRSLALTAALSQTLFDGGRLRSQVQSSESQRRQLVESYRKSILVALKEVEDALSNVVRYREQETAQTAIRDEAQRSLRLAELRYREGATDLASVLDAQRSLYSAQDQLAQIRLSRLASAVAMAKALGGGWENGAAASTDFTN